METVSGVNNWKLLCCREGAGVTLVRAVTCDARAALPETVWGLPVTALADHALSPTARPAEGEEVLVTCGPLGEDPGWDNRQLRELTLPPALERVGNYALLNCGALERLCLHDGIRSWGGGALMNCRSLRAFRLRRTGGAEGESLAYFADELTRELDVTILRPGGETVRLLFPEYGEAYEENISAHHFDYTIVGAGYPYHHCFRQRQLHLRDYDGLWRGYLGMEYDPFCALRLAWWRLRYPAELSPQAEADYLRYLRSHAPQAVAWLLDRGDAAGLRFLLDRAAPDRETLAAACALARERRAAEALAILLE